MKQSVYAMSVALFLGGTLLTGCQSDEKTAEEGTVEERMEEVGNKVDEKAEDFSEWLEFRRAAKEEIAENRAKIAEIRVRQEKSGKLVEKMQQDRIERLQKENERLQEQIDNYDPENNKADGERWENFKRELERNMDQLGQEIRDIGKDKDDKK